MYKYGTDQWLISDQNEVSIPDISSSITDSNARGADFTIYGVSNIGAWAVETFYDLKLVTPTGSSPPFPPVYPVLFSSDEIYGREHFGVPLKMIRGDTYTRTFYCILDGQPFDLTGSFLRMTFKWSLKDQDNEAFLILTSPNNGMQILDAASGKASFTILPNQTSNLPGVKVELYYDIQVTDAASRVYTVAYGKFIIVPDASITIY